MQKTENPAGRPGFQDKQTQLKNRYLNYTYSDAKLLRKFQSEMKNTFLSKLAGRIANGLERKVLN